MGVQRLFGEHLALLQHELIQMRQGGRIETDGIFHQQDNLHPHACRVVGGVHLVLDEFDDGKQQLGIAQPAEHIVDGAQILVGYPLGNLAGEWCQDDNRDVRVARLDFRRRGENIPVIHVRHTDNQLEITVLQLRQRLILGRHLREAGRIAQTERRIFVENLFVHTPIVFQHKGVVFRRDKQHIINALIHQIGKRGVFKHQILKIRYSAHVCIRSYLTAPNVEKKTIQQTVFRRVNRNTPKVVRFSLRPTEGTPACAIFCMYIHILITRKRRDKEFKKYICAFEYYS